MWGRKVLGGTEAGWRAAVCSDRRAGRLRVGRQVLRSTEEKVSSLHVPHRKLFHIPASWAVGILATYCPVSPANETMRVFLSLL